MTDWKAHWDDADKQIRELKDELRTHDDLAIASGLRIAELEAAINAFLVAEHENYHDCTPAMDAAIDVLQELVDWHRQVHRKALEGG